MKGFYLYCFREKNPALIKAVRTIDKGEASTLPYEKLEAVVSEVDLEKFSSNEIRRKAQEDVHWIKGKAQIHEHVIERAMVVGGRIVPVVPMKFGTIFKTKKNLKQVLKKNYSKFKKLLEKLEDKQEWGVKVYLDEEVFEKQLEKKSKTILKKKKEIDSLPKGADFFVKKQAEEIIEREKIRRLGKVTEKIFADLKKLAVKANQGKNLDRALTGRKEPMVLNANLLIKEEKAGKFQKEVNELKAKYKNLGLIIQESGPWPPYNFVS